MPKYIKPKTVKLPGSNKLGGMDSGVGDLKYYGESGKAAAKLKRAGLSEYLDPDQVDHQINISRRRHKHQLGGFTTKGKEKLLNQQTTRKGLGAGLLKEIKRKLMRHIPGKLKKTY